MKDFKKYYIINASSEEVYLALTNPFTIELWTGEKAEMSTEPNSEFSLLDGSLVGRNLEFIENKMIVQEWYFGDENPDNLNFKIGAYYTISEERFLEILSMLKEKYNIEIIEKIWWEFKKFEPKILE